MEPVAEGDLQDYMQESCEGTTSLGERRLQSLQYTRCLSKTLSELHGRGIRHCDIKPQNILVHEAHILLTDFGTAFATKEETMKGYTRTLGTDKYDPLEAFSGQEQGLGRISRGRTGRKEDVFGLGCVFYEMLEELSVHASIPKTDNNYAALASDQSLVQQVLAVK